MAGLRINLLRMEGIRYILLLRIIIHILRPLSQLLIPQRAEIQVLSFPDYVKHVGHISG